LLTAGILISYADCVLIDAFPSVHVTWRKDRQAYSGFSGVVSDPRLEIDQPLQAAPHNVVEPPTPSRHFNADRMAALQ
jgi:hypothetical protein